MSLVVERFSDKELQVLSHLSHYKFLSYRQLLALGVDKHRSNLSRVVNGLKSGKKPYVKTIPHRFGTEGKHYLTKRAKDVLTKLRDVEEETILYPKGHIKTDTQDQAHRTSIIDLHILLDQQSLANDLEVIFCDRYFDTTGSNRVARNLKSKTAIIYEGKKTLKADMTFMLKTPRKNELYLLELENGQNAKKAVPKCIQHGKAILLASANELYNHQDGYRTLWVFENESTMISVMERVQKLTFFKALHEFFLFKSLDQIYAESDFFSGWRNLQGVNRKMYY